MISLVPATVDEKNIYTQVSASRRASNASLLLALQPDVFAAYAAYEAICDAPSGVASVAHTNDERKVLRTNYERLNQAFGEIRRDVFLRSARCCLCGDANAGTLDHHLPRALWPEFSILTSNLIPCCSRCNLLKSNSHSRKDGGPLFLHPYLDWLPTSPVLAVEVDAISEFAIRYAMVLPSGMPTATFETVQSHFVALDLARLYRQAAIVHINEQLLAYREYLREPAGAGSVRRYLDRDARSAQQRLGINHWRVVLLHGLAACDDFCEGGFESIAAED